MDWTGLHVDQDQYHESEITVELSLDIGWRVIGIEGYRGSADVILSLSSIAHFLIQTGFLIGPHR